ncbi:hypothetical protein IL252_14550 (plasmid) [Halomicrobium sp. IBSBa]|uniref:hypothetical protein n=1 Tax=Halomicrobium sp. IBSBa TaxID=2778916 RepID=UPI001ABFDF58|nr:hypothetical protein [Halomicrobium sp. IBSBa]MBO4249037.1 hypothetical protein [Halomicrobium sp. IBSBa]
MEPTGLVTLDRDTAAGGLDQIGVDDLDQHSRAAQESLFEDAKGNLGTHKRLLLDIVQAAGEISGSELRAEYENRTGSPNSGSTRRRMLNSLKSYNMIADNGRSGPARRYYTVDESGWKSG